MVEDGGRMALEFVWDPKNKGYSGSARYVLDFNACPVEVGKVGGGDTSLVFHTMMLSDVEQLKMDLERHLDNVIHLLNLCRQNKVTG